MFEELLIARRGKPIHTGRIVHSTTGALVSDQADQPTSPEQTPELPSGPSVPAGADAPVQLAPAPGVRGQLPCLSCNYNLETLAEDSVCPECGKPIGATLASLRGAQREVVHRYASGVRLMLYAVLFGPLLWIVGAISAVFFAAIAGMSAELGFWFGVLGAAAFLVGPVIAALGVFRITAFAREPSERGVMSRARVLRLKVLAISFVAIFACAAGLPILAVLNFAPQGGDQLASAAACGAWLMRNIVLCSTFASVSRRATARSVIAFIAARWSALVTLTLGACALVLEYLSSTGSDGVFIPAEIVLLLCTGAFWVSVVVHFILWLAAASILSRRLRACERVVAARDGAMTPPSA